MSKIVYLLGAGASYGEREKDDKDQEKFGIVKRGIPVVSEFPKAIDYLMGGIRYGVYDNKNRLPDNNENQYKQKVLKELIWLKGICDTYPTVDTYAKMLYVKDEKTEYNRLKEAISIFLLLSQTFESRDLRYDGFIASLINRNRELPSDIHILSWNYDAQFELAYSGYRKDYITLPFIWHDLNVLHKNMEISNGTTRGFSITKLNGTAFFINKKDTTEEGIQDIYFQNQDESPTSIISKLLTADNVIPTLSFAWEKKQKDEDKNAEHDTFIKQIQEKLIITEVLVVIGYSFPYVNREIDRALLNSMFGLKKIYIQDPNADEIKESILATLYPNKETQYTWVLSKNTRQFIIPNELI